MERYSIRGDVLICRFPERIDTIESQTIESELNSRVDTSSIIRFDLSEVDYICSSFLRICLWYYQHFGKDRFQIVNVKLPVQKVLEMANLAQLVQG